MNRIDRLTAIMLKLQSKRHVTIDDISDHFDISERTVFRDIKALGEAGVPIGFEKDKGYFIVEGYYIPPVMFTKEEAGAILLAGKLLERQGDRSLVDQFEQALTKVRAVLKNTQKDYVQELEKYIEVVSPTIPVEQAFPDLFLNDIKNALINHQVLSFEYYANYSDTYSSREVEPLGICHYANHWHLIAYCRMRNGVRDFRTDRISKLHVLDQHFDPSLRDDFKDHIFVRQMPQDVSEVKVLFDKKVARIIGDQRYYYGFIDENKTVEGIEMTFMVGECEYFARWLLMFTDSARILNSEKMEQQMQELIAQLEKHYQAQLMP
ncbi:MAG: YafY family protein [Reichenbachiella sp.]|uniref:helix-turn-helix transcriptional regulator n=1 Tax=Reichenbachiella sp. TaxID=2184521 RepID=UPI00296729E3|nr:YafY family protein [Reichenbachiella sp.]MDW3211334.1 YafY family protein [Reichenbachiella sp.]